MRSDMARNNKLFNYTFKLNQRMKVASIIKVEGWLLQKDSLAKKMPYNNYKNIDVFKVNFTHLCNRPLKCFTKTSFVYRKKNQTQDVFCIPCIPSIIKFGSYFHKRAEWDIVKNKLINLKFEFLHSNIDLYLFDIYLKDTLVGHITCKGTNRYNEIILKAIELSNIEDLLFDRYKHIKINRDFMSFEYAIKYLEKNYFTILHYYKLKIDNL